MASYSRDSQEPSASPAGLPGRIHRLEARLINQIAAGEVVTRPAAALKELVENSLDAGATRIEIHVEEGALEFLVRDDGVGMDEENLLLSIERHATSKIAELEDLARLETRGFRGEALAALAAVSRLEIVTRTADRAEGLRLKVSGDGEPRVTACGAPTGTTVHVRDLFYNTPVRLKFLKNPVAEWGHMLQAAIRQALTRPDVAFSIRWKGRPYLDLPAGQTLAARLAEVLPGGAGARLIAVDGALENVSVRGAVSHPTHARRDRRHQYFMINGRPVAFRPLQFALEEAFRGLLMVQRYPLCAIAIELPGEMVDVNVHPTKEEVRLRNDALVTGAVHRAVAEALRLADLVPTLRMAEPPGQGSQGGQSSQSSHSGQPGQPRQNGSQSGQAVWPMGGLGAIGQKFAPPSAPFGGGHGQAHSSAAPYELSQGESPALATGQAAASPTNPASPNDQLDFVPGFGLPGATNSGASISGDAEPVAREEATLIARLRRAPAPPRVLAQVAATYILADAGPEGLLVIDQHAAHEKILYLDYRRQAARPGGVDVQPLLVPHAIDLAPAEVPAMEALRPALAEAGFDVEPFGGRTFLVQAVPATLERLDAAAFLRDLIDDLGGGDLSRELARVRHAIAARAACRAAVKSGDPLTREEMERLVEQLLETEDSLRCPHGRPTVLRLTRDQLDAQFGRLG
jgi:DNA mismatch repair protein MutL